VTFDLVLCQIKRLQLSRRSGDSAAAAAAAAADSDVDADAELRQNDDRATFFWAHT